MENIDNVREMLGYINADNYDIYLKVVASLKYSATMGDMTMDDARNLAEEWAATSSKFDPHISIHAPAKGATKRRRSL